MVRAIVKDGSKNYTRGSAGWLENCGQIVERQSNRWRIEVFGRVFSALPEIWGGYERRDKIPRKQGESDCQRWVWKTKHKGSVGGLENCGLKLWNWGSPISGGLQVFLSALPTIHEFAGCLLFLPIRVSWWQRRDAWPAVDFVRC